LHDSYTYRVPEKWHSAIKPGQSVVVQFGQKKAIMPRLFYRFLKIEPDNMEIKDVQQLLDDEPVVAAKSISNLWKFIAKYYCCNFRRCFQGSHSQRV
jgi:primosomal protein N' (replication factor Y) (superfamily II helicase)